MKKLTFLLLLGISCLCFSQIPTKIMKPVDFNKHVKSRVTTESSQKFLPAIDIEEMIEEDLKEPADMPFRFGKAIKVDFDLSS